MTDLEIFDVAPKVSVIMANYNGAAYIAEALHSVLAQTLTDIEVLVSDDASTDSSVEIVRQIAAADPRVHLLLSPQNAGPAVARNRALARATGKWISIVDSDDIIRHDRFERLIALAEDLQSDGIADDLTYFGDRGTNSGETLLGSFAPKEPVEITADLLISSELDNRDPQPLGYLKPIFRRESLTGMRYNEDLHIGEDHEFYLRLLLDGKRFHLTGQSFYDYRRHPNSISHRLDATDLDLMIQSHRQIAATHSGISNGLRELFRLREAGLRDSKDFALLVDLIKSRRMVHAACHIFRWPKTLKPLFRAFKENRQRRRTAVSSNQVQKLQRSEKI